MKIDKNGKVYSVNESIVYSDYEIDIELESVGIKKLLNLFNNLKDLKKGALLIYDELDSHINDVYLIKLIEYISEFAKGQLIFTTHNASPMEFLKTKKHSIDFLSISGELTPWLQVGNYSPVNAYRRGMINKLPFNVSGKDFIKAFADGDN